MSMRARPVAGSVARIVTGPAFLACFAAALLAITILAGFLVDADPALCVAVVTAGLVVAALLRAEGRHRSTRSDIARLEAHLTAVAADVGEVADRLKLTALSLGRITEDLAQGRVMATVPPADSGHTRESDAAMAVSIGPADV
jgi:hypothetical protein